MKKIFIGAGALILVVVVAIGVIKSVKRNNEGQSSNSSARQETPTVNNKTSPPDINSLPAGNYDKTASLTMTQGKCAGVGPVPIIPPMKLDQVSSILPYGLMVGGHVTPIDHQYYNGIDIHAVRDTYDVVAPADARVTQIQHRGSKINTPLHSVDVPSSDEYRIIFAHTCSFLTYVDLVTSLDDSFKAKLPAGWTPNSNSEIDVTVKQGDIIGHIGGQTLDFAVWDLSQKPLPGLLVRKAYDNAESWKVFTAPTTNFLAPSIKAATIAKYTRTVAPIDGKIDYDVEGKMIGSWFLVGSNGYDGGRVTDQSKQAYWGGHLSIAPNFVDPSMYTISLGSYTNDQTPPAADNAQQFGIKGNAPDPATIGVDTGLVKYELVKQEVHKPNGQLWQNELVAPLKAVNSTTVSGVVLMQMTEAHKMRVEIFPGKTAAQVSAFDANARMYNRGDDATIKPDTRT